MWLWIVVKYFLLKGPSMGKIRVIGVGGAGINVAGFLNESLGGLARGRDISTLEYLYLDTSKSNISRIDHDEDKFFLVSTKSLTKDLDGSGGERRTNAEYIKNNIPAFIDQYRLVDRELSMYTIVVFSLSGGSGSVAGPLLVNELLTRNVPVMAIVVGDTRNQQSAINTKGSIVTLNNVAKKSRKVLPLVYFDNNIIDVEDIEDGVDDELLVNGWVKSTVETLMVLTGGGVGEIDQQDIVNFLQPGNYSKLNIPAGVYGVSVYKDTIPPAESGSTSIPVMARGMIPNGVTAPRLSPELNLLQYKRGLLAEHLSARINTAVYVVLMSNYLYDKNTFVESRLEIFDNLSKIRVAEIHGTGDHDDDDDGLLEF